MDQNIIITPKLLNMSQCYMCKELIMDDEYCYLTNCLSKICSSCYRNKSDNDLKCDCYGEHTYEQILMSEYNLKINTEYKCEICKSHDKEIKYVNKDEHGCIILSCEEHLNSTSIKLKNWLDNHFVEENNICINKYKEYMIKVKQLYDNLSQYNRLHSVYHMLEMIKDHTQQYQQRCNVLKEVNNSIPDKFKIEYRKVIDGIRYLLFHNNDLYYVCIIYNVNGYLDIVTPECVHKDCVFKSLHKVIDEFYSSNTNEFITNVISQSNVRFNDHFPRVAKVLYNYAIKYNKPTLSRYLKM